MSESYLKGYLQITLWEKEKLLVTSDFSFSHSVFNRLELQTRKNQGLFGKGLSSNTFFLDDLRSSSSLGAHKQVLVSLWSVCQSISQYYTYTLCGQFEIFLLSISIYWLWHYRSLSNRTIDSLKLKAFAVDKIIVTSVEYWKKKIGGGWERNENI